MGGQWVVTKPSRSDEVLEEDQQLRIANQIRAHFDSLAPKRPLKPNRSEIDSTTTTPQDDSFEDGNIPELDKFKYLQSLSHTICAEEGASQVQEEFVETQYYKELNSIDKQHHTTGYGFIKVVREGSEDGYGLQLQRGLDGEARETVMGFKSNPATNDWIPRVDEEDQAIFVSSKPNRSESC